MRQSRLLLPVVAAGLGGCGATRIHVTQRPTAGQVATQAPGFELPRHRGGTLTSAAMTGQRVALVFYRGHW